MGGCAAGSANTKDLLDSRSLVYYSLTQTIYDLCPGGGFSVLCRSTPPAYRISCVCKAELSTGEVGEGMDLEGTNLAEAWS